MEDGKTFRDNALIKARKIYELFHSQYPDSAVIADDSGLEVDSGLAAGQMIVNEGKEKLTDNSLIAF